MRLPWLLPLLLAALLASAAGWPPVVDEESYLDIAAQVAEHPLRPYDWYRPWQPWGPERPEDAYLFAHPPLHLWWLAAWGQALPFGPGLRLAVGLPWALLLGWALASLAERSGAGARGAWLWLSGPVLVLGVQSSLMIDLPVLAFSAAAVAAWQRCARGEGGRWGLAAGLLLGLAASTKYPALTLVPVLALDAQRRHVLRRIWPLWAGLLLTWGALELLLAAQYGRVHLLHVLQTAGQIGRGPLLGRAAGTLVRAGLLASPLLLLGARLPALSLGALSALFAGAVVSGQLEPSGVALCAALAFTGGALLAEALTLPAEALQHPQDERPLLALWLVAALAAVVLGHNYVGGRYLLPATAPLALLLAVRMKHVSTHVFTGAVLLSAALALSVSQAERRYALAADEVAQAAHAAALARGADPGWFTGEWTFRWRMRELGWRFYAGQPLPSGALVARPQHASPGSTPEAWRLLAALPSAEQGGLRLIDLEAGVGYHAETLGPMPLAITPGPLEQVELYEVP